MFRSKIYLSYLLILACIATHSRAGSKFPTCKQGQGQGWDVLGNRANNHSVCDLAQSLLNNSNPCHMPKALQALPSNMSWYNASDFAFESLKCVCTSTVRNLLTACAACQKWSLDEAKNQNQQWQSLQEYEADSNNENNNICQSYLEGGGLQLEPDYEDHNDRQVWNTTAPSWAMSMNDLEFSLTTALDLADPKNTSSTNSSTATTNTATPNPTSTSAIDNATTNKSSPNIGAIVGGVVGGIAFLGAIFGLLLFLHRRKRHARDVAPSSEFLKPEYYSSPPLLPANRQRDSEYRDDIEEEPAPLSASRTLSWVGGMVATRRHEDDRDEMLPPFTQGTYIGPSPHEKGHPERRHTDESDATATSNTHLLSSSSRPGTSE